MPDEQKTAAAAQMVPKLNFDALKKDFDDLKKTYDDLVALHADFVANQEVLKAQLPKPDESTAAGLPPVGSHVTFVNHGGVHEKAVVTGHGHRGVHIDVQGIHKNDKYSRKEVPVGGPDKTLTVF